ncbi:MAG TPA: helix-turn-helix domain-containing protein [Mycobacterium sp.]|nr:helix-turn-helix domain-containing protein [Mycobacterium sp.]
MTSRSYGQYCGLARALDVVGGRWSLLIVRELLVGPARYRELQAGLPGIATNLLAERLRHLEAAGVVQRQLDNESNGVVYALTPWGDKLRGAIDGLVNWSAPLMVSGPCGDSFRTHWLAVALRALLRGKQSEVPITVAVEVDDSTIVTVHVDQTGARVALDGDRQVETVLSAEPAVVLGLAAGALTVEQAIAAGVVRGDKNQLAAALAPS